MSVGVWAGCYDSLTPTVDSSNFLLNRYIKCGLLFRNAVGDRDSRAVGERCGKNIRNAAGRLERNEKSKTGNDHRWLGMCK